MTKTAPHRVLSTVLMVVVLGHAKAADLGGERGETATPRAAELVANEEVASAIHLLEAWIESQMDYRGLPGVSIGIVHDQDLIWTRGFGYADVEKKIPASPDTIYRIASISKLFTATAIMQLRDLGKLQLDDPVAKHLAWFKIKNPYPDAPSITIRHLLTHTAGLPREVPFPYWTDFQFPTREQMIASLPNQQAVYPADTRWKYSNLAVALAGEIVAAVSGEPYEKYIQDHILEPLGMKSSGVVLRTEHRARLATGYGRRMPDGKREIPPFTDARSITPAAGLSSTVEDLARFASLQFRDGAVGGNQIVSGPTLREMQRVHWLNPDWSSGYGLGFRVIHRDSGDLVGHGGWIRGYQTSVFTCPKQKVAIIALTNADDGHPSPGIPDSIVDHAFKWLIPAITKAVAPPAKRKGAKTTWQRYVGKYRDPWRDSQVLIMSDRLMLIDPTDQDPTATAATLTPVADHTFRMEGGPPFGPNGELVVFELDNAGKVRRMKVGENYSYPQR